MKLLVVIAGLVALTSASVIPQEELPPKDNSHYVEGKSRYVWMNIDGQDDPLLVDLEEPVDEEFIARNGANNQYRLFTNSNPSNAQILVNGNAASVLNSNFVASRPTMVIVHGWNNNGNSPMNPLIRDHFLRVHTGNVIVVDWGALASSSYTTAAAGAPSVGQHLGNFLAWVFRTTSGGNWSNVHLVGFSLGAHIVGAAGNTIGGRVVGRVTGLDPAGPGWHSNSNRLSTNAGRYVEAIHTEGVILGIGSAIAHVDFFPNGGQTQPGCGVLNSSCSHGRSTELFASTIVNNRFTGRQCSNVSQANSGSCTGGTLNMGNAVINKSGSGIYHVTTGSSFPF